MVNRFRYFRTIAQKTDKPLNTSTMHSLSMKILILVDLLVVYSQTFYTIRTKCSEILLKKMKVNKFLQKVISNVARDSLDSRNSIITTY